MIPFILPAALKAIPWRLVGYGVAVGAILLLGWRVHAWHEAYKAYPKVVAALKAEEACDIGSKCQARQAAAEARQAAINDQTVRDYEQKLAEITSRPAPAGPVRLCRPASSGNVRLAPAAPATGAGSGSELPVEVGRDIAVELYQLADDADTEALKLRELWNRDVALSTR
jgi:hypothetical protein